MSKGSRSSNNVVAQPWKAAQPALRNALRTTANMAGRPSFERAFEPVGRPGQSFVGKSDLERSGLGMLRHGALASYPMLQGASGALGRIQNGGQQIQALAAPGRVRSVNMGDLNAVTDNILESVIPDVNASFSNSGMTGSPMHAATLAREATSAIAPAQYNAFMQAQGMNQGADQANIGFGLQRGMANQNAQAQNIGNILRSVSMAPGLASAFSLPGQQMLDAGRYDRNIRQGIRSDREADIAQGRMSDIQAQQWINDQLRAFGGLGGTQRGGSGNRPGVLETVGTIGSALAPFALFCDRRLKRDIREIGKWKGVPLYVFRYLWDDVLRIGPMADEVPDRARMNINGVDLVIPEAL